MTKHRVRLAPSVDELVVRPDRVQLVSFALWDPDEPEGEREPVGLDPTGRTLVLRWPTDTGGRLDVQALRDGRVDVLVWTPSRGALEALQALRPSWPPDLSDFWLSGDTARPRVVPTLQTLRTMPLGLDLDARVDAALRSFAA